MVVEKDWNARFERAQKGPRYWRIILGVTLIVCEIGFGLFFGFANVVFQGASHVESRHDPKGLGITAGAVLVFVFACWLIGSGCMSGKVNIPKD